MLKSPLTGVDSQTTFILDFETLQAQAILTCGITISTPSTIPGAVIRLRNGNILVDAPIYRPKSVKVQWFDKPGSNKVAKEEVKQFDIPEGGGWHYQADEVARCLRDGKLESDIWTHEKTILEMEIFDEVCRKSAVVILV